MLNDIRPRIPFKIEGQEAVWSIDVAQEILRADWVCFDK